jgi:hypothetical protein
METITKKLATDKEKEQSENQTQKEPKKLSKAGQWMRDNPGGMFYVKDRRAINRMRY